MNLPRLLVALTAAFALHVGTAAAAPIYSDDPEVEGLRQMVCAAKGGVDITDQGTLTLGGDVSSAVVCAGAAEPAAAGTAVTPTADVQPLALCGQFSSVCASLYPPSGTYTITSSNPTFTTSCSADVNVRSRPGGGTSIGTSTLNCRAYTPGGSAVGCNVNWSGPSSFPVGVRTNVSVSFDCLVAGPGSRGTVADFSYQDATYGAVRADGQQTSSLTIVLQ